MSNLQILLEKANKDKGTKKKMHGGFPFEIASECGPDEIAEIIQKLDTFQAGKEKIESWDGDSRDDYWKLQKDYSKLLEHLTHKYPLEVATGLQSDYKETAFWVSHVFCKSPTPKVISKIKTYLENSMPVHYRSTAVEALEACKSKQSLFDRLFQKNA